VEPRALEVKMSKGIAVHTAKHGLTPMLIAAAISIGIVGAYVAYPHSGAQRAVMAKIGRAAAAGGMAGFFTWTQPDQ
jgi:3-deoxy-D-manno-octulosonic acid (KDO) 8-phosphate synthase